MLAALGPKVSPFSGRLQLLLRQAHSPQHPVPWWSGPVMDPRCNDEPYLKSCMGRYLVVAHQTADSPQLLTRILELAATDSAAEFVLLVPATPVAHLLLWEEGEAVAVARRRAKSAMDRLQVAGVPAVAARVGDGSPLEAITDELRQHPDYDAIIISTLPSGLSRWLGIDLPARVARELSVKVIHVEAQPTASQEARAAKG